MPKFTSNQKVYLGDDRIYVYRIKYSIPPIVQGEVRMYNVERGGRSKYVLETNLVAVETFPPSGSSNSYYDLPEDAKDIHDLIEKKDMSWSVANIFKAAYRLGSKDRVSRAYDLEKIIWFAERELRLERKKT